MKTNYFKSGLLPVGSAMKWAGTMILLCLLTISPQVWGANTPAAAGTYTLTSSNKPGGENKFYKLGNGVYIHRRNNSSQDNNGLKVISSNTNGIAVYVNSSMNLSCSIYKASSKAAQTVGINVYTLSNGSTTFDSFESGTNNSTTVSVTLSASATYTTSVSFDALGSKKAETKSSSNITLAAGYYYIVPAETTSEGKTYLKSITLAAAASGPSVSSFSPASGAKLKTGATVTVTGSSGSTVYCLWASSAQTASAIKSGTAGTSGAASVTSAGIASANGTTLYAVAVKDATDSDVASASYTIDDTAPTLSSSTPANGAYNIPLSGNIVLTFSENVTINDASKFSISPSEGVTLNTGSATASTNTVTIPYSGLSSGTTYTFSSAAGAVKDEAGNTSAALSDMAFDTYNCAVSSCGNASLTYSINASTDVTNTAANLLSGATPSNPTALSTNSTAVLNTITINASSNAGKAAAATNYCSNKPTMSSKIGMYNGSSYSSTSYVQFTCTINSGYTFTPCDIQFVVQPVSAEGHFRWEITDGSNSYGYGTGSAPVGSGNGATVLTGLQSTSEMDPGTYYIRLYPYYNGSNTFRISNDVVLRGTTAASGGSTYTLTTTVGTSGAATGGASITNGSVSSIPSGTTVTDNSDNTFTINTTSPTTVTATSSVSGVAGPDDDACTYVFKEWENLPSSVTADVSNIHAIYEARFVLNLLNPDGTATSQDPWYYVYGVGRAANEYPTPTRDGYTFDGWYEETTLETEVNDYTVDDGTYGTATVYAKWTPNSCTDAELAYGTTEVAKTYGDAAFTNTLTNSHSVSVTYSSTNTSVATVDSYGEVTIKVAGNATIKATLSGDATYCDEEVSYTLTVSKADLAGTASTGTASSVTHNSASLPFTISTSTDGIASMTIKVYAGESLAKTYSDITPASSGSYSATDLSASTTYTYTITLIGDANHNNKAETSKSTSFTTGATPTLTALVAGTLYEAQDMANVTLSSDTWFAGLSSNNRFKTYGNGTSNSAKGSTISSTTVGDASFTSKAYIMASDVTSGSSDPTYGAIELITPSTAGLLYIYTENGSNSQLTLRKKGSSTFTALTNSDKVNAIAVDADSHYFINGSGGKRGIYGVKFIALYSITLDDNGDYDGNGSAKVAPNGKALLSLSAPTRTGYDVEGYYGEAGCTTKIATAAGALQASKSVSEVEYTNSSSQWTKGSGATLYAKWTPAVYTVTLDADGGTINSGNVTSYTYGVGATLPVAGDMTAPSGAVFLGWYDGATKVISISTTATGNKSYKAKWGYTLYDSYFYQTYEVSASEVSASTLITNAGFPAYMGTNISANGNTTPSSDITTPHDFSALSSKTYYIKAASSKTVTLSGLADVKTVRFYGNKPSSSRTITTTATLVSGTGSNLTISDKAISGSDKIIEASINISGASGYSSSNYYDYTFTFSNDFYLYGIYVEKYTNVPVTGVSLNKSSTTLTAGDTEQLTATIAPANATNKAVTWTSSNTSAATVSPTGLITAKAAGETTITVTTSDGSYTATCDVTVEAFSCAKFTGKIFELEVIATSNQSYSTSKTDEPEFNSSHVTVTDGHAYAAATSDSKTSRQHITASSSIGYIYLQTNSSVDWSAKLNLTKCALRNGDVISFTQKAGDSNQISITTSGMRSTDNSSTSGSYTVTPGDGLAGASTIYLWHASSRVALKTLTITRPTSYVLTYNVNGGRAETAPDADRFAAGANELTTDRPVRSGYVLKGWTEDAEGEETLYRPGAVYTMPSSAQTLYAQWKTPALDDAYASDELSSKTTSNSVNCTALINGLGNNSAPYKLSNSGSYYGITLARGNFKVGDVVTFKIKRSSGSTATIYREAAGTNQVYQLSGISSSGDINVEFTVTQAMLDAGLTNTVVMARTGSDTQNHEMYWIKVKRNYCDGCMAPKTGVTTWSSTASDWIGQDGVAEDVPTSDDVVFIDKAIIVGDGVTAQAAEVIIGESGSITISPTGGLIVEGGIRQSGDVATDASDIVINTSASGQGLLIFDNPSAGNQATINMYSKANKAGSTRNWQYMAIPIQEASVSDFFYGVGTYTYKHIEAQGGWVRYGLGTTLNAFDGIGLTQEEVTDYTFYGTLVSTANHTYSVTNVKKGNNIVGNSWPAPINLKALSEDDFTNVELDIAIYNTGSDNKSAWTTGTSTEAGTWDHVPLSLVGGVFANDWAGTTVIPAFQAFQLKATGAGSVTIDYDRCVRNVADGHANDALRAPSRRGTNSDDKQLLRLAVQDTIGIDYIYLIEGSEFTEGYDNGWEAAYSKGIRFGKLYALDAEANKKMALARPDLEGTMVGFVPGVSNTYTITFNQTEGYYYLNDLKKEESTLIQKGNSYTFTVEEGDAAERFMISGTPFAKTNPTGVDKVQGDKVQSDKVRKVLIDDHLYIIRAGKIFDATGGRIK